MRSSALQKGKVALTCCYVCNFDSLCILLYLAEGGDRYGFCVMANVANGFTKRKVNLNLNLLQ
jgi:hypothetical protein